MHMYYVYVKFILSNFVFVCMVLYKLFVDVTKLRGLFDVNTIKL